jgi:ankyrin repeat protein
VKWLLKKQANARDKSKDQTTPLMVSAENGSKKIGLKLVKKNANVNARNVQGNTALMLSLRAQKEHRQGQRRGPSSHQAATFRHGG